MSTALTLPGPLRAPLETAVRETLEGAFHVDFTQPAGQPALVGPDSVSWRVFKNPVTLFIGGAAAVILELAEPRVRAGVWDHTKFREDPLGRLRRTGLAAMVTVYGARTVAEAMIDGVGRRHARVTGVTETGQAYAASDPELLDWVQATAAFGFLEAYAAFARPLSSAERDAYYAEGQSAARLYGAVGVPTSTAGVEALFGATLPRLEPSPVIFEFLDIMRTTPALPGVAKALQPSLLRAAIDIVPADLRIRLGLERLGLRAWDRPLVRAAARAADRLVLDSSPAVQACRRLGLPADHLYR
jgi:uncharacterized protein (DUF2236 family)